MVMRSVNWPTVLPALLARPALLRRAWRRFVPAMSVTATQNRAVHGVEGCLASTGCCSGDMCCFWAGRIVSCSKPMSTLHPKQQRGVASGDTVRPPSCWRELSTTMMRPYCPVALPVFALEFPRNRSDILLVSSGPSMRIHSVPSGEMLVEHEALWGGAKVHGMRLGECDGDGCLEVLLYGNKKVELLLVTGLPAAPTKDHSGALVDHAPTSRPQVISIWAHMASDLVLEAKILSTTDEVSNEQVHAASSEKKREERSVMIGLAHNQIEVIALPWGGMGSAQAVMLYGQSAEVGPTNQPATRRPPYTRSAAAAAAVSIATTGRGLVFRLSQTDVYMRVYVRVPLH